MTAIESQSLINRFPMGPRVRDWLKISEDRYSGHDNMSPAAHEVAQFTDAMLKTLEDTQPKDASHLVDLLEELVGMNMPLVAIKFADAYPQFIPQDDFRAHLHLGNAAMLVSDLARAEDAFITAQRLVPAEPAPYINLTQIYCHDGLLEKARTWCVAGLNAESDNMRLWELMAWIEQNREDSNARSGSAADRLSSMAKEQNSWAGTSLASDLRDPEDVVGKASALEAFWNEGCRDKNFLVEYTAVLGMAGRYDHIPSIIWTVEKELQKDLPWQLYLHMAQAYLGLGRDQDALAVLDKLNKLSDLPDIAREATQALYREARGESLPN